MPKVQEKISLGVRVIIIRNNKVLVVKQTKPNGQKVYVLPGGGIKKGEDVFTAAEREVKEESCLKIRPQKLLYLKELFGPNQHSFEFYVLGEIKEGRLCLGCDPELSKARQILKSVLFIPLEDLKKINFFPQELRVKLKNDWQKRFGDITAYLGVQRFSPKQYKHLFGPK